MNYTQDIKPHFLRPINQFLIIRFNLSKFIYNLLIQMLDFISLNLFALLIMQLFLDNHHHHFYIMKHFKSSFFQGD